MNKNNEYSKTAIYLLVLAIQLFGAIFFVWQQLASFRQVLLIRVSNFRTTFALIVLRSVFCP
jgi:hypothetical protein